MRKPAASGTGFWLPLLLAAVLLAGGVGWWIVESRKSEANPEAWPTSVERRFIDSCVSTGGNEVYCGCVLLNIQNEVSFERFVTLEQRYLATKEWPDEVIDAAVPCLADGQSVALASAPAPVPPRPTASPEQVASAIDEATRNTLPEFTTNPERWDIYRDDVLGELLCFTVSYQNVGRVDGAPPTTEFSLVGPSGKVLLMGFKLDSDPVADFQYVVPGTKGTFQKCFASNGERGEFTLRRDDLTFSHDGEWTIPVSTK